MSNYALQLRPPAFLVVSTADGSKEARIDVLEANRMLTEAEKQPSEDNRWKMVRGWLASRLEVEPNQLAESNLRHFWEMVVAITNKEAVEISKNVVGIACSQPATQESQTTIPAGQ